MDPDPGAARPEPDGPARATGAVAALGKVWSVLWRTIALLAVWAVLLGPLFAVLGPRLVEGAAAAPAWVRLLVEGGSALALLLATLVLVRLVDRQPLASVGLRRGRILREAATGAALAAAWLGATLLPIAAAGGIAIDVGGRFSWFTLVVAGVALGLNAFMQELLFRGYLFQLVRRTAGATAAVAATSALFSLAHLPATRGAWLPVLDIALAGALFGVARVRSDALWLPVGLHAGWNVLVGPVLGLDLSGRTDLGAGWHLLALRGPDLATGGAFGLEGSVATTVTTIVAIALLARRGRAGALSASAPGSPPAAG